MGNPSKIHVGDRFSRLLVLEKVPYNNRNCKWKCQCDCGTIKDIFPAGLLNGETKSCGCLQKELYILRKKYNDYDLSGEYGVGHSSNSEDLFYFDLEDYDLIKNHCWFVGKYDGYVATNIPKMNKSLKMHRLVMGVADGEIVDHKSRIRTDNRKENLRVVTPSQNSINSNISSYNSSGITGVSWNKEKCAWDSYLNINHNRIRLGRFNNKQNAIIARLQAELKYFGIEFAPQRHLFEEYNII